MTEASITAIVSALNDHQVRYLIVGGLAVVAHGFARLTMDVDLVLEIDRANLERAVTALKSLGFHPRVPVPIEHFIDPEARRRWASEKNMMVFSLQSPQHQRTEIDLFLEPPFDFASAYSRAVRLEVAPGINASFCGLDDLIELKSKAGRNVDLQDIEQLRNIQKKGQS